jgi:hypothetical protein
VVQHATISCSALLDTAAIAPYTGWGKPNKRSPRKLVHATVAEQISRCLKQHKAISTSTALESQKRGGSRARARQVYLETTCVARRAARNTQKGSINF